MSEIDYMGRKILSAIHWLKKQHEPLCCSMPIELYLVDEEYDVKVVVSLKSKKSQYEHGMEMFK